jgi:aspartate/methionine/tyrosine aminotransferase
MDETGGKNLSIKTRLGKKVRSLHRTGWKETVSIVEETKKAGKNVLNLYGYPFRQQQNLPEHVLSAFRDAADKTTVPDSKGLKELRVALADTLSPELGIPIDPNSEILITNGAMQAIYVTFQTLLSPGDGVFVPTPCFFMDGCVIMSDGVNMFFPTYEKDEYKWNLDEMEEVIEKNESIKIFYLNTPVNPTGRVLRPEELERIAEIAIRKDLVVITDESYEIMVYDNLKHHSIISIPGMKERTIFIRSFTKSYVMPNIRTGYIIASKEYIVQFTKVLEWMILESNYICQKAAAAAVSGQKVWLQNVARECQSNRDYLYEKLKGIPDISYVKPEGGPYYLLNVSGLGDCTKDFSEFLMRKYGIPNTRGFHFQAENYIRIAFVAFEDTLDQLASRMKNAIAEFKEIKNLG